MEEQNNIENPMPPRMYPQNPGNYLWRIISPLVVQLGVSFVVSLVAGTALGVWYLMQHYGLGIEAFGDARQMEMLSARFMHDYDQIMRGMDAELYKYGAITQGITALLTIPFLWVMFHRDRIRENLRGFVPNKKASLWKYGAVIVLGATLCVGVNNLMILGGVSTVGEEYVTMMEGLYSAPLVIQIASLVILVPICEEMVFRGLIFRRIRETSGFKRAAFHSALIFGLMHMNLVQMLYGFALGMVFAYIYEKYGSVKAPILAHMTANFVSVAGMHFGWFNWMQEESVRIGVITVFCATLASAMYVLIQKIDEKPDKPASDDMLQKC